MWMIRWVSMWGWKVNYRFDERINKIYGGYIKVKSTRVQVHYDLVMTFDFYEKNKVNIDMIYYMDAIVDVYPSNQIQMIQSQTQSVTL